MVDGQQKDAGSVGVDVYPDGSQFEARLKAAAIPAAAKVGQQIAKTIAAPIARQIASSVTAGVRDGGKAAKPAATKVGQDLGGEIGKQISARVRASIETLPDASIGVDFRDIDEQIAELRAELDALAEGRISIGVDIDGEAARTELAEIIGEVDALAALDPTINVDADITAASAELDAIGAEAEAVGALDPTITVDVDTGGATASLAAMDSAAGFSGGRIQGLIALGAALAPIIAPAAAVAAAGIGAIGTAAVGAFAGLAVLFLALSRIVSVVGLMSQAQKHAGGSTSSATSQAYALASANDQVASATQAFTNAQQQAAQAQRDLTAARVEATQAMQDLQNKVTDGLIAQERAELAVAQAQQRVAETRTALSSAQDAAKAAAAGLTGAQQQLGAAKTTGDPAQVAAALSAVTAAQKANTTAQEAAVKAALDYRSAQIDQQAAAQALREQVLQNQRLAAEEKASAKAGVEGSDQVVAAKAKIQQADQQVISAERQLAAAHRSVTQALQQGSDSASSSVNQLDQAMAALTPQGRAFATFLYGLKPVLGQLQGAAERTFLPPLQKAIEALLPYVPALTGFIGRLGGVLGDLAVQATASLGDPVWRSFFGYVNQVAGPVVTGFFKIIMNLAKGLAGLTVAFGPVAKQIGGGLVTLSARFADLGANATKSKTFQSFIAYVLKEGPILARLVGNIVVFVVKLAVVLAPLGDLVLRGLGVLFSWLAKLDPKWIAAIAIAIGTIVLVLVALADANPIALIAIGIVLLVGGLIYAWNHFQTFRTVVLTVINAVATAALWLWHTVIYPAYQAIAAVVLWAWSKVIQPAMLGWQLIFTQVVGPALMTFWHSILVPAFTAMGIAIHLWWAGVQNIFQILHSWWTVILGPALLWLWHNVVEPAFTGIRLAISIAWAIISVIFGLIQIAVQNVIGPLFLWLWQHVIGPAWTAISIAISIAWAIIKVIFGLIEIYVKAVLAPIFLWLWHTIIEPAFRNIGAVISFVWNKGIKPIFELLANFIEKNVAPPFKRGVDALGKFWDGLREKAKGPVEFVVNKVINGAIIDNFNTLAKKFGVDQVPEVKLPKGWSGGGYTGPGGKFAPRGIVHAGEWVLTQEQVQDIGVGRLNAAYGGGRLPRYPGDGSQGVALPLPGYADGGLVGALDNIWQDVTDPAAAIKKALDKIVPKVPDSGIMVDLAKGEVGHLVDGFGKWILGMFGGGSTTGPVSGTVQKALTFIRSVNHKPYGWAQAGPDSWDCSGLISSVYNILHGKSPYSHTFSTSNEASFFPLAGAGVLTAGWSNPGEPGGGDVGHTAGRLAGVPFESGGALGDVHFGKGSTPVASFAHIGHPVGYDSGGYLPTGLTTVFNGTGKPEPVFTDEQWRALAARGRGGDGSSVTYETNVYPQRADFGVDELEQLQHQREVRSRVGRPH